MQFYLSGWFTWEFPEKEKKEKKTCRKEIKVWLNVSIVFKIYLWIGVEESGENGSSSEKWFGISRRKFESLNWISLKSIYKAINHIKRTKTEKSNNF